jgi:hypothetical protein
MPGQLASDRSGPEVYTPGMRITLRFIGVLGLALGSGLRGDAPASLPPLPELIGILRTNLDLGSVEFETRASEALIERFGVRRIAGTPSPATPASPATDLIARRERLDGGILYLRPGRVDAGLPAALRSALTDSAWTTHALSLIHI